MKPAAKLILRESSSYRFQGPGLTLGVPDIYARAADLAAWFPALAGRPFPLSPAEVTPATSELGRELGWVSADTFLRSIGVPDWLSLDIPGAEHAPDRIHDLNDPLPDDLIDRFNFILDPGTLEHIFDVKTALTNTIRALKTGGVIVHLVPIYSYNGGYFSYNPIVLIDFYRANGFAAIKAYIILWDRYRPFADRHRCYEYTPELAPRYALADRDQARYVPHLLFFARKETAVEAIVSPLQSGEGEAGSGQRAFARVVRLTRSPLLYQTIYYLHALFRRERTLRRNVRRSFRI